MTKELKRFEQWWDAEDDIPNDGPYTPDTPIQFAWAGWQAALAQPEQKEKFCDSNCVWTDHHPDCNLAQSEQESVAMADYMALMKKYVALKAAQPEQEPVAWEQFYPDMGKPQLEMKVEGPRHVVCQCDKCKAQPEQDNTYAYASSLAKTIWQKHYIKESPKFALLDTTEGVLTQIDNMTCGLVREKPAQQEPVAWMNDKTPSGIFARHMEGAKNFGCTIPLYTHPPQRKPLTTEMVLDLFDAHGVYGSKWLEFARAIEAAHGIKENT